MNPNTAGRANQELQASAREFVPDKTNCTAYTEEPRASKLVSFHENPKAPALQASAKAFVPANRNSDRGYASPPAPLCRFFARGSCRNGLDCPFIHESAQACEHSAEEEAWSSIYTLENGVHCEFGPGMSVTNLMLGNVEDDPSTTVLISGLSPVAEYDIKARLSQFGRLLKLMIVSSGDVSFNFQASFSNPHSARIAAHALNGTAVASWIGDSPRSSIQNQGVVAVSILENKEEVIDRNLGSSVRVEWEAPCRCAWVRFSRSSKAKKAATECNGKALHGRELLANFMPTTCRQNTSFTMLIDNVAGSVAEERLKSFVERHAKCRVVSVEFGKLSYTESMAPALVQKLLKRSGGPILSFNVAPHHSEGALTRKAMARFANANDAKKAFEFFQRHDSIIELGGSKLSLQRIFSAKYSLPVDIFDCIRDNVEAAVKECPSLRYRLFKNMSSRTISIQAYDPNVHTSMKRNLDSIVAGYVVMDPANAHRPMWHRCVLSGGFKEKIKELARSRNVAILCDKRRREVRVYGPDDQQRTMKILIQEYCADAMIETHAVPISQHEFKYMLLNGRSTVEKIMLATSARKVSIDIKNQSLLVEGNALQAKRAKAYISKLASGQEQTKEQGNSHGCLCPVCLCPPGEDNESHDNVIRLSCNHCYCRSCFDAWVGVENMRAHPLLCLDGTCSEPVALQDLNKHLDPQRFFSLLRLSVDNHVRKNPSKLQFCVSPTCPGIFRLKENSRKAPCSSCSLVFCTECKVSHAGLTCKQYELATRPPDKIRMHIIDEILTLRCPRCGQAFLDFDGCFALFCEMCDCSFCAWCLEDCGFDAHEHVMSCPSRIAGACETFEEFQTAQNKRRREVVLAFLEKQSPSDREATVASIQGDLIDLGIQL